jgi:hypothetical protein
MTIRFPALISFSLDIDMSASGGYPNCRVVRCQPRGIASIHYIPPRSRICDAARKHTMITDQLHQSCLEQALLPNSGGYERLGSVIISKNHRDPYKDRIRRTAPGARERSVETQFRHFTAPRSI